MSTSLALRILSLAAERDRVGIGDVVRELGASRSSAYRALQSLEASGHLLLSETGRGYGAGPALLRLAEVPAVDAASRRAFAPVLGAIRDATGETVHASVLLGSQVLVLDGRRSAHEVDMGSRIGMTAPAHSMAAGKLLLAALDDRLVRAMIPADELPRRTSRTIGAADELMAELARVREQGYAMAVQESEAGVDSIALPLDGSTPRTRVAVVVSVPSERGGIRRLRSMGAIAGECLAAAADEGVIAPWRTDSRRGRP